MHLRKSLVVLCSLLAFLAESALAETKPVSKKKKAEVEEDTGGGFFLPDWGSPDFGFGLGPIAGFKNQRYQDERVKENTYQSEFGVRGFVSGIPLWPGNPGLYIRPHAGVAWGRIDGDSKVKATDVKTDIKRSYRRAWAGADTTLLYHWYRHTLGLTYGKKTFSDGDDDLSSMEIENDFGVALIPTISAHYTHRYLQAKYDDFSEPFLREHDNWVHGKFAISLLDWSIDFGPGFTFVTAKVLQDDPNEKTYLGRTDYVKLVGFFDIFWKLYASVYGKYVYRSDVSEEGTGSRAQLPDEGLYEPRTVAMPEDSLDAIELVGLSDLFLGFGIAYQTHQQILNMSEKDGTKRQQTNDQGIVMTYQARF